MNPVGSNQQVTVHARAVTQYCGNTRRVLLIPCNTGTQPDRIGHAISHAGAQRFNQIYAVNVQILAPPPRLRRFPQRHRKDIGPAPAQAQFLRAGAKSIPRNPRRRAKRIEHLHSVGAELQSGADLGNLRRALQNGDGMALFQERQRSCEPTYTATCNQDVHGLAAGP